MADAGRILIMPKGDYDPSVSYEMLDLVLYNNIAWLAKRDVIGIEPSDDNSWYWFKMIEGNGDATTLGGKGASEYNLGEIRMSEKALDTLGTDYSIPNTWTYIGFITPTEKFSDSGWLMGGGRYGIMGIYFDNYAHGTQIIFGGLGIKRRSLNSKVWGEWQTITTTADLANYLPRTGGTVGGALTITGKMSLLQEMHITNNGGTGVVGADNTHIRLTTIQDVTDVTTRRFMGIYTSGTKTLGEAVQLCDVISGKPTYYPILHSGNVGSYALPINGGGTVTAPSGSNVAITVKGNGANVGISWFGFKDYANNALGYLGFGGSGTPRYLSGDGKYQYDLHHDGNSAKVVVSETPLTAEGSVRVW